MPKYDWRDPAINTIRISKEVDPQVVGEELDRITVQHQGRLDPHDVVKAAKPPQSPIHDCFEWNNRLAAEAYRLDQARTLIRAIVITSEDDEEPRRAWYSIQDRSGISYRGLSEILSNRDLQLSLLHRAEADLAAFTKRYREIEHVCDLVRRARERLREQIHEEENRPS